MKPTEAQINAIYNFYCKALGPLEARWAMREWHDKTRKEASEEISRLIELRSKGQWTGPLDRKNEHDAEMARHKLSVQAVFETMKKLGD